MSGLPPKPPEPARGALAGIKADLQRAKETGKAYDPRGAGNAYTHNFLNQKPWHPMNFRNQIKKYEAEQADIKAKKLNEQALAEFEAEQEMMKTMSYLSEEDQKRYKDRQSISFMYAKPPGLDAALQKEAAQAAAKEKAEKEKQAATEAAAKAASLAGAIVPAGGAAAPAAGGAAAVVDAAAQRARDMDRVREDPYAVMLQARAALEKNSRLFIKGVAGRNVHGNFSAHDANQMLLEDEGGPQPGPSSQHHHQQVRQGVELLPGVVADATDLAVLQRMSEEERAAVMKRLKKMQAEQERQHKLKEAQAVLEAAGYDVSGLDLHLKGSGESKKDKKRRKHKSSKSKSSSKSKKERGKDKDKQEKDSSSRGRDGQQKERSRSKSKRRRRSRGRASSSGSSSDSSSGSSSSDSSGSSRGSSKEGSKDRRGEAR